MAQKKKSLSSVLQTQRLTLRGIKAKDAPEIFALRSNDEVNAFIGRPKMTELRAAKGFVNEIIIVTASQKWFYWAIVIKGAAQLIGTICLWNIDEKNSSIDVGYEMLPAYQGHGFMHEALIAVVGFATKTLGFKTVTAYTMADNERSVKLLTKTGFVKDEERDGGVEVVYVSTPVL